MAISEKSSIFAADFANAEQMVGVAQLVRVPDCGSEGRGFESHLPPKARGSREPLFLLVPAICGKMCTFAPQIEGHGKDNGNRPRT